MRSCTGEQSDIATSPRILDDAAPPGHLAGFDGSFRTLRILETVRIRFVQPPPTRLGAICFASGNAPGDRETHSTAACADFVAASEGANRGGRNSPDAKEMRISAGLEGERAANEACRSLSPVVERSRLLVSRTRTGGTGLARVLCTRAALRRPSVWSAMHHREGCFSPAVGQVAELFAVAWNNPADRGPTTNSSATWPAGP